MDQVVDLPTIGNLARLCEFRFEIVEMREIRIVWHMQSHKTKSDGVILEFRRSNGLDCTHQIDQAFPLKVAISSKICRGGQEDLFNFFRSTGEFSTN